MLQNCIKFLSILVAATMFLSCGDNEEPQPVFPGTDKYYDGKPGMKIIGVLEVNDTNPLNCIGFTLADDGKQFFDIVVLFAANINLNADTGKPYVSCNENVQALLDARDKYIRPLQQRGIKVVLGILGNHDPAGISTLDNELSQVFAADVRRVCDAYGLDGVFLDDEYTDYNEAASGKYPGIGRASTAKASRLAYQIRQQQPERLIISYRYKNLSKAVAVGGMQPGEIFDYVVNDYWDTADPTSYYPGLRQEQAGTGSWNCSDWSKCIPSASMWQRLFSLTDMRDKGYGALMIFNFRCQPDYSLTPDILSDMNSACRDFWNASLSYDGVWYPKDY